MGAPTAHPELGCVTSIFNLERRLALLPLGDPDPYLHLTTPHALATESTKSPQTRGTHGIGVVEWRGHRPGRMRNLHLREASRFGEIVPSIGTIYP